MQVSFIIYTFDYTITTTIMNEFTFTVNGKAKVGTMFTYTGETNRYFTNGVEYKSTYRGFIDNEENDHWTIWTKIENLFKQSNI